MKNQLTLKETRELKNLFLESNGVLTEGIVDKIKDSIKKRFTGRDTGELKQSLSDNLGIDENTSVEEIEEKLEQETGGKKDFRILTKILREILGLSSAYLIWELQALIGAGIIKYFDYNPIAIAAVVISVIFSVTENWEKIRRKGLGKKVDQFIYGKRSHLGDFDDNKKDKENDNEMNESRKKVIRLTESDLTRIVKRVIEESKNKDNLELRARMALSRLGYSYSVLQHYSRQDLIDTLRRESEDRFGNEKLEDLANQLESHGHIDEY